MAVMHKPLLEVEVTRRSETQLIMRYVIAGEP
jgi:hypothetical protein